MILYLKYGGGGCNVFLTFYAISNISRKKNLGIQNNYFSFNVVDRDSGIHIQYIYNKNCGVSF